MRKNRQDRVRPTASTTTPAECFDSLIERAACCLTISSLDELEEERANALYQQAIDCMMKAAHSPFFGGTETSVSYEGLAVVREEVFERVRDELIRRGYRF